MCVEWLEEPYIYNGENEGIKNWEQGHMIIHVAKNWKNTRKWVREPRQVKATIVFCRDNHGFSSRLSGITERN